MVEINREADLEAVERLEARPFVAVAHNDGFLDAHETLRRGLFFYTCGLQQEYERSGTAIHDRHFRRRQVDVSVVDTEASNGGEQMFDRGDANVAFNQRGGQAGVTDVFARGADLHRIGEVDATKHDPCVHGRWP